MKWKILAALAALLLLCAACGDRGNRPYEPDTPAPAPHTGAFTSDHGSLRFHGDGETVEYDFDAELSALTGLPEGEHEGTYVFLSGDLPPNGSVPVRYDTAHELRITTGDKTAVISLGLVAEDGKSATVGVNTVTPERIPLLFTAEGGSFSIVFAKGGTE